MNQLNFIDDNELLELFHTNKTEMSCMDEPHTFLNKLRDHTLIPEERYKNVIRIKDKREASIYELLDWIETEAPWSIRLFWTCVFTESILTRYPTLKRLQERLFDGSSRNLTKEGLLEDKYLEKERGGRGRRGSFCDQDDQQGHSSSQPTPRKRKKPTCGGEGTSSSTGTPSAPAELESVGTQSETEQDLPGGEGTSSSTGTPRAPAELESVGTQSETEQDLPGSLLGENHLPVTCGNQQGTLYPTKLEKAERCILSSKKWYTPVEFEKLSGKESFRNWKKSISCSGGTLETLLKRKTLRCPGYKKSKAKRSLLPCSSKNGSAIADSEEALEEEEGEELQANSSDTGDNLEEVTDKGPRDSQNVFRVTCGTLTGMLHKCRFASGRCGNSIRTEDHWLSPMEFVQGSAVPNALWRRDIQWEGQPLSSLIESETLSLHSEQCDCPLCQTDPQDKNDDECFVCRSEGDLVMCDHCPRSFHPKCHLPQVDPSSPEAWMCTFCIWKKTEYRYQMTHEEILMHSVSSHMLQCHYLLLTLFNADKKRIFAHDPSVAFSGYSSHIGTPMWLNKIREQLLDQRYTVKKFLNNIQLIFSNCDQFNKNNTVNRDMGVKLKEFYEQEKEKVFLSNSREVQRADGPWTT